MIQPLGSTDTQFTNKNKVRPLRRTYLSVMIFLIFVVAVTGCTTTLPLVDHTVTAVPTTPTNTTGSPEGTIPMSASSTAEQQIKTASPATPVIVRLAMSHAPQLNEEIALSYTIESIEDVAEATFEITLSPNGKVLNGKPHWQGALHPDVSVQEAVTVVFETPGEYTITANVLAPIDEGMVWGDSDYIYLTIGDEHSFFGFTSGNNSELTQGVQTPTSQP